MRSSKPSDSFRLSQLILAAAGFFPRSSRGGLAGRRAHLMYSGLVVGLFVLALAAQLAYFAANWRNVDSTVSTIPMLGVQLACVQKIYVFWKKNQRITGLFDLMDGGSWARDHAAARALVFTVPVGTALLAVMPVVNGFLWLLFPMLGAAEYFKFPIKFWMPDYSAHPVGYYVMLGCETMVISLVGAAETVMNTIICGFMAHVRAQLVILREKLQSLGKRPVESRHRHERGCKMATGNFKKNRKERRLHTDTIHEMAAGDGHISDSSHKMAGGIIRNALNFLKPYYKHTVDLFVQTEGTSDEDERQGDVLRRVCRDELQGEFVKCLQHHQTILNFVKELESIFTWVVFTHFAISAIIICSATLQITMVSTKSIEFYFSVIFACGMCTELAIYCYFGNNIIEESSLLPEAIYKCDWLSSDIAFRRQMLIFMETTRAPITISAGKFFQLSNQTFLNILKSSYSYYAVFKGLRANGKLEQ